MLDIITTLFPDINRSVSAKMVVCFYHSFQNSWIPWRLFLFYVSEAQGRHDVPPSIPAAYCFLFGRFATRYFEGTKNRRTKQLIVCLRTDPNIWRGGRNAEADGEGKGPVRGRRRRSAGGSGRWRHKESGKS